MSELAFTEGVITSSTVVPTFENIAERRTIVYETLVDPTVVRIAAEKNKSRLFNRFLFKLNRPEEIEFVSIEKHYEPYVVVSGKYSIDYFRKCAYSVIVDRQVKEVILLEHSFTPGQALGSSNRNGITLEGEERLFNETSAFLILNRSGQDSKLNELPSAPSEKNPQELIESFKMPQIDPVIDIEVIRKRIEHRPLDVNRIVNEAFLIDQRSVIYTPRYKLTYKCPKLGKEAYLEFDGVTSKLVGQNDNFMLLALGAVSSTVNRIFRFATNSTKHLATKIKRSQTIQKFAR